MRVRSLAAVIAIALAQSSAGGPRSPPRRAAPAPSAADLAAAKKLFQTGLKLYNEGSYREALASFRKANDIAPRASIQRNIAQCHRDLKDFAAAYDAYKLLLSKYGGTMSAADRALDRARDRRARDADRQHPRHGDRARRHRDRRRPRRRDDAARRAAAREPRPARRRRGEGGARADPQGGEADRGRRGDRRRPDAAGGDHRTPGRDRAARREGRGLRRRDRTWGRRRGKGT